MELVALEITPLSNFATLPKGDTLFGQILAYLYLDESNNREVLDYFNDYLNAVPNLIVSDMMPLGYVYKPTLPLSCFKKPNSEEVEKKELRKRKFIAPANLQNGDLHLCEKVDFEKTLLSVKNSINRATFTTDGDDYAPYGNVEMSYYKKLWLFILVKDEIKNKIIDTIKEIGKFGFGKEATNGKGNFDLIEIDIPFKKELDSDYYLALSPTILKDENIEQSWYEPFTKFGKFGLHNAYTNAFKKPVLMAESGSVVKLKEPKAYFGKALNNGTEEKVSHFQGYSIALPIKIKDTSCLKNTK